MKPVHLLSKFVAPVFGKKVQYAENDKELPLLPPEDLKRIKEAVGIFLYYACTIDGTMHIAINDLTATQSK